MDYQHIKVSLDDGIATITMCRAPQRNSLSEEHIRELLAAFQAVADSDARGIILAAEGPVFCSGHDFNDMKDRSLDEMRELLAVCAEFMQLVQHIPQPVVAQVEGLATAAGCQLVASCDMAVAGESTGFQTPGGQGGWFCHTPGVALVRAIGKKRALEMLFTGDRIDAKTAADWGLINRVVADADVAREARAFLERATRGSSQSKAEGKVAFYRQADLDTAEAYTFSSEVMATTSQSADAKENTSAFLEKRKPNFVGRRAKNDAT
ncbi:MAG: enoyl-CoA hydratase-related protein [Candidatus Rariloculaceae bacterium]